MAAKRGMNERIQKLRELSVTTPVHIDLERAKIETEFYKENDGKYSIPVMRSMVLKEYFSKKTLYLGEGELIVGERKRSTGITYIPGTVLSQRRRYDSHERT